jgi:hypothetical protein
MRRDVDNEACPICGEIPFDDNRRVLVSGGVRRSYCSQACLRTGVRVLQIAQRRRRLRRWAFLLGLALVVTGAGYLRHRLRWVQPPREPVAAPAPPQPELPPESIPFGPRWPPTDDEWQEQLAKPEWVDPLPGPTRHRPVASSQMFVAARCRTAGRCGVDLGGELWGEHVYAAHDGVIDHLQRNEDGQGGVYVRIAHVSGVVFTHYFHLAAIPSHLAVGARVAAGDVIGLVGDTGLSAGAPAHLRFALSIRPSSDLPEVYWDPEPLMASWPLHTPERGSVAGLVSADAPPERVAGTPSVLAHSPAPVRSRRPVSAGE